MDITPLFYTGLMIATGLLFGKLAKIVKLPNVTGYLIGGLIVGPSVLGLLDADFFAGLELISTVALGFIAFSIGNEFKISYFKRVGPGSIIIAFFEAFFGVIFVLSMLLLFFVITKNLTIETLRFSLVLSAIAAATAPASTLLVIRQYKAKGPLTDTLLSVVAIDDSVAIVLFGILVAVANALNPLAVHTSLISQIFAPVLEILISLGIGAFFGLIITFGIKWFTGRGNRISLVVAVIFLTIFIADWAGGSSLLACMIVGAFFANLSEKYEEINGLIYFVTPPIFIIFFVLSGAELQLNVLLSIGAIGLIYALFRVFGKIFGAWFGAKISHSDPVVSKLLGFTLIPQEGVSIGLSIAAAAVFGTGSILGTQIRVVILATVLIYELIGPVVTKMVLKKAGEIHIDA
ncbi:MAG: cation:proton antiporter [Firmicutes bacterium]|nr:cation:proton antiporter [Bacillota bacterium]